MFKPLRPIARPAQPPEVIRATLAGHKAKARLHTPLGVLSDADVKGLIKRTALDCGVTPAQVMEVCGD